MGPLRKAWVAWMMAEATLLAYCKYVLWTRMQAQPSPDKVAVISSQERTELFQRCLSTFSSPEAFVEAWFITDSPFAALSRRNIREFLAWGMFHRHDVVVDMKHSATEEDLELERMVDAFLAKCTSAKQRHLFYDGDDDASHHRLMKFTSEPVTHTHRPLAMYVVVQHLVQEIAAPLRLGLWFGFHRRQCGDMVYYVLPGTTAARHDLPPVVFIHGLGVGLLPYDAVVRDLVERASPSSSSPLAGRTVLLIELHATSQRLAPSELLRDQFVDQVRQVFAYEQVVGGGAIFLGHSYGSFAVGWMCQRAPDLVCAVGLLDPVCLFLHHPKALHTIFYKQPENAAERAVHFAIRGELNWNYHVRRHFFWYANVLFLESTGNKPVLVVLSENDTIVPVEAGKEYVEQYISRQQDHQHAVNLVHLDECEHGGFLFHAHHRERVLRGIEWVVSSSSSQ